ncbi:MAG: Uncharacterized MFS-type transporter, partial [uncultured Thermomicrobiales bacterium]
ADGDPSRDRGRTGSGRRRGGRGVSPDGSTLPRRLPGGAGRVRLPAALAGPALRCPRRGARPDRSTAARLRRDRLGRTAEPDLRRRARPPDPPRAGRRRPRRPGRSPGLDGRRRSRSGRPGSAAAVRGRRLADRGRGESGRGRQCPRPAGGVGGRADGRLGGAVGSGALDLPGRRQRCPGGGAGARGGGDRSRRGRAGVRHPGGLLPRLGRVPLSAGAAHRRPRSGAGRESAAGRPAGGRRRGAGRPPQPDRARRLRRGDPLADGCCLLRRGHAGAPRRDDGAGGASRFRLRPVDGGLRCRDDGRRHRCRAGRAADRAPAADGDRLPGAADARPGRAGAAAAGPLRLLVRARLHGRLGGDRDAGVPGGGGAGRAAGSRLRGLRGRPRPRRGGRLHRRRLRDATTRPGGNPRPRRRPGGPRRPAPVAGDGRRRRNAEPPAGQGRL